MPNLVYFRPTSFALRYSRSGNNRNGNGSGPGGLVYEPRGTSQLEPRGPGTPLSAYRMFMFFGLFWIAALFATLTLILESRWVHSRDWVSIPLPHVLYLNTAILLGSSLTIEFARFSLRADASKERARWIEVTLLLGFAFMAGQIVAWRELIARGLHLASNPGSFFFYLLTGTHGLLFLGATGSLAFVSVVVNRAASRVKRRAALDNLALYWHFVNGLWLYLLALLFVAIQG